MLIIGNLDPDGYFRMPAVDGEDDDSAVRDPLVRVAFEAGVGIEFAEHVLKRVQSLDPLGVAARDLRECLLLQARQLNADLPEVVAIIERHLKHLESKNYAAIARDLKIPVEEVVEGGEGHRRLRAQARAAPTPARRRSTSPRTSTSTRWATATSPCSTTTASPSCGSRASTGRRSRTASAGAAKEYIQDKLRSAVWLIRSIHQRQRTIYKVTESIVKFQRDFFDKGIAHLKPLILRDVAEDIGMHESTVSRVTTNKYVHTPQGIYELKFFFNSAIARTGGDEIASEAVKNHIKQIVAAEDAEAPPLGPEDRRAAARGRTSRSPGGRWPSTGKCWASSPAPSGRSSSDLLLWRWNAMTPFGDMQFVGRATVLVLPREEDSGASRPMHFASQRRTQEETMQVNITFRHLEPTEALKAHVKDKVEHVQRYVDRPTEAHAVLHVENLSHHAELTVKAGPFLLRGRRQVQGHVRLHRRGGRQDRAAAEEAQGEGAQPQGDPHPKDWAPVDVRHDVLDEPQDARRHGWSRPRSSRPSR